MYATERRRIVDSFQPGDVLGFSAGNCADALINLGTCGWPGWSISHVAVVIAHPSDGGPVLWEAASNRPDPCILQHRLVKGVQVHRIGRRLVEFRVRGGRVWHYPLARPLSERESYLLTKEAEYWLGTPYDWWGAFCARTIGCGWLRHLLPNREDTGNLFCSEGIAVLLRKVGRFCTENASKWNPNWFCRWGTIIGAFEKPELIAGRRHQMRA